MKKEKFKLKRNGVMLEPEGEIGAIFNCGATEYEGEVYLLPRAVMKGYTKKETGHGYDNYVSEIWLAKSRGGKNFTLSDEPFIKSNKPYNHGCEDARVTKLNGEYFITYTVLAEPAFSGKGGRIGLASTKDFSSFEKHGIIGPDVSGKNAVIFPDKVNGKIGVLHRTDPITSPIRILYFDNIEQLKENHDERVWKKYLGELDKHVVLSREYEWESKKIGAGPPPIKTDEGWILIYHGVDKNKIYRVGAALLDLDNPQKVIARSSNPILEPEMDYEKKGDVSNVVFPGGAVLKKDELFIYYGAADTRCCLATCELNELIDSLLYY